jgi:hypothetical protein
MMSRRAVLGGATGVALAATSERIARATLEDGRPPVLFLSHGSPRLPIDPVRSGELRAWGATLPKPRAVLAMTPHFGTRHLKLGVIGPGKAMYNMPDWIGRQLPPGLDYPTPTNGALATRVEALLTCSRRPTRPFSSSRFPIEAMPRSSPSDGASRPFGRRAFSLWPAGR